MKNKGFDRFSLWLVMFDVLIFIVAYSILSKF
jgi:hypothetical protein